MTIPVFGTAAARLDDGANFLPSRLAAVLMIASAFLLGMDGPGAFRIYCRDRKNHKSPNAAQTESVMAGAWEWSLREMPGILGNFMKSPPSGIRKGPLRSKISEGPTGCFTAPVSWPWQSLWESNAACFGCDDRRLR